MISFRNILRIVFVITLCFLAQSASATVFNEGETIKYEVKSLGVKLGDATLVFNGRTMIGQKERVLVTFTAKGMNFYDEEMIYLDPDTFFPVMVKRDLNIFGKKEKITEIYDQKKGTVEITINSKKKTKHLSLKQDNAIENIYGFIFRSRKSAKFSEGNKIKLQLPTQEVNIDILKQTKIALAGKKYEAFLMKGTPKRIKIWFDVGENKIPLRIKGAMGIGNTTMSMVEYLP